MRVLDYRKNKSLKETGQMKGTAFITCTCHVNTAERQGQKAMSQYSKKYSNYTHTMHSYQGVAKICHMTK